ncbi:MAG: PAS domain-containing protein [Leptospiraceae bacterium]|nr:PAS domain-containing protein [Leptospiraceae bacterium]
MDNHKKTILLVEDNSIIAMHEKMQLEKIGYSIQLVMTGEDAIETVMNSYSNYDLILMDIDLGDGIDGTEAAKSILKVRDIPIVFLSSHTEPEIVEKTEKITSYGYVVKNSGIVILDASIKMAFKLYDTKMELIAAKEKAELNEYRLIEAQTATKVGSWQTDLFNFNVIWSEETFRIFEINPQTFKASHSAFLEFVHPEDREKVDEAFKKSFSNEDYNYIDHRIITSTGNVKYVEERWRIVKDSEGKPVLAVGTCQDISERKNAEVEIRKQLSEKEILLKEVHHRIKNNIASIEGLLSIQADSTSNEEVKIILQESITRIQSTRILYEKLLISKDYQELSIKNYIDSLIDSLFSVFPESKNIIIQKNITDFVLNSKKVIPVGIIINEVMTNIFKYAFKDNSNPIVKIELKKIENHITLTIQDNGIGIEERVEANTSPGFGLTLVRMLAEQLNGTYTIENDNGTKSVLKFEI